MATPTESATIITATWFEYLLTRLAARHCRVIHAGMRLERLGGAQPQVRPLVLCGLAGSLVPGLEPGSVLIPSRVADVDGNQFDCDPRLIQLLRAAATRLGYEAADGLLLTATRIITGEERAIWAERGMVAADMEAALLARLSVPFATLRVILDGPSRSLAESWERPVSALLQRQGWREIAWLATAAPGYTLRAARIAAMALGS